MAFKFNPFTGTFDIVNAPNAADTFIFSGTDDPQSVAQDIPKGSLYIRTSTAEIYVKTDSGSSVNFLKIVTST